MYGSYFYHPNKYNRYGTLSLFVLLIIANAEHVATLTKLWLADAIFSRIQYSRCCVSEGVWISY